MLRVTVEGQTFPDFDDRRLLNTEAIALKKTTGLGPQALWDGVEAFDGEALTALVWLVRYRGGERPPELRYGQLVFDLGAFDLQEIDEDGRVVTRDRKTKAVTHLDGEPVEPPDPQTQPAEGS